MIDRNSPPDSLPPDAVAIWPHVVDELAARGKLAGVSTIRLRRYVQFLAQFYRVTGFINEEGQIIAIRDDKGVVKKIEIAPEAVQQIKLDAQLQRYEKEFGLQSQAEGDGEKETGQEEAVDPFQALADSLRSRMANSPQSVN